MLCVFPGFLYDDDDDDDAADDDDVASGCYIPRVHDYWPSREPSQMTLLDFAVDDGFTMFQLSDPLFSGKGNHCGQVSGAAERLHHRDLAQKLQKLTENHWSSQSWRNLVAWIIPGSLSSLLFMSQILCRGYQGMNTSRCVATGLDNPLPGVAGPNRTRGPSSWCETLGGDHEPSAIWPLRLRQVPTESWGSRGRGRGKAPEVPEDMGKMGKSMWRCLQLIKSLKIIEFDCQS